MVPISGAGEEVIPPRAEALGGEEWTVHSLATYLLRVIDDLDIRTREHFEQNEKRVLEHKAGLQASILAIERASQAAMEASEKAILKSEASSEKRFDAVNEWRALQADQSNKLISRTEAEQRIFAVSDKINDLGDRMNRLEGRGVGMQTSWSVLVAAVSIAILIIGVVVSFLKH